MKQIVIFLCGGFFYISLCFLFIREYSIITEAKEIVVKLDENGDFSFIDEESEDKQVLTDTIGRIVSDIDEDENEMDISEDYTENMSEDYTDSESESSEVITTEQFRLMVLFCLGLIVGVIVGHFLTGFIK